MSKLKSYIGVLLALLLVAMPFMEPQATVEKPAEVTYCQCCQGPCQGCCCAMPESDDSAKSEQHDSACTCDFSPAQPVPQVPITAIQPRVDGQTTPEEPVTLTEVTQPTQTTCSVDLSSHSPPPEPCSPPYILFGALLI